MRAFLFCPFCGKGSLVSTGFTCHWGTSTQANSTSFRCANCGERIEVVDEPVKVKVQVLE